MKFLKLVGLSALLTLPAIAQQADVRSNLALTPDHFPQDGVPRGRLEGPFEFHSEIMAGTVRLYWVFVPAQYTDDEPAAIAVFQDGQRASNPEGSIRAPQVLENLIHAGAMPVTIGLFVTPGHRSDTYPDAGTGNPNNRAQEYDAIDDRYARMLIEELIPRVGEEYRLTDDPEQRMITGTSSGAIAAFTAAWFRPDYFRKVYSGIGSYVSIGFQSNADPIRLGGQDYPALIRREPIRPLRIFFQDGTNDLDNEWGNWFLANQQMVSALAYANRIADRRQREGARYEFTYVWTDGQHSDEHPGALLPEALRWLWRAD
jgi:enterochelin esterase family protein